MRRKLKPTGFTLPSLFNHSTFSAYVLYYTAWPNKKNGTNYWCLDVAIGWPGFGKTFDVKLDFWRPRDMAGWVIIDNPDGSTITIHSSQLNKNI